MKYKYKISAEIKLDILIEDKAIEMQIFSLKTIKNREFYYELSFEIQKDSPEDPQLDTTEQMNKITEIISTILNCKIIKRKINTIENTTTGETSSDRCITGQVYIINRSTLAITDKDVQLLEIMFEISDEKLLNACRLFYEAKNAKDNSTKFWLLYSILQFLVGERRSIDQKYKIDNPNSRTLYSDHDRCERSTIIAIRDIFSHIDSTYSGKHLNLTAELNRSIAEIENFTRNIIIEETTISQQRQ